MGTKPAAPARATSHSVKTPKKIIALSFLVEGPLIQLEAFQLYGETCLHSTISELCHKHDLVFERSREPHTHRHGGKTHFTRYRLSDKSQATAKALISSYPPLPYEVAA